MGTYGTYATYGTQFAPNVLSRERGQPARRSLWSTGLHASCAGGVGTMSTSTKRLGWPPLESTTLGFGRSNFCRFRDLDQFPCSYIVNEAVDRDSVRNQRMIPNTANIGGDGRSRILKR
jgi:hypothetical protein